MKWVGQYIQNLKATFRQNVTLDSTLTFDSVALTGIQTSAESFVDNDVSIMTSAAIDDRINAAVTAEDLDVAADSGTAAVDLNSQSLEVRGGTNATTSATGQAVTINVDDAFIKNDADDATSGSLTVTGAAGITIKDGTTSSATEGGNLILASDDGAVMADNHRLGVIEFKGAEDTSSTMSIGARIQAIARDAWDGSNNDADLEFYTTDGTTESKALTLDADNLATFAGAVSIDSVSIAAVQTSGETFVDNDTSLMTSSAIDDKINTKYAYTYLNWSASCKPTRDGSNNPEWMMPNTGKGIYEEDWNNDTGITSTTTGTTTYGLSRYHAANSIILPHAGVLVGFHAIGRNDDSDLTFKAGLFHADNGSGSAGADGSAGEGIDYGATGATNEYTLRCVATAVETEASGGTDGTSGHSFRGPCKLISNTADLTVQAGDALMPAIMGNSSNSTDEIFVTMTIILKIPITT
mgnify:CR=1 FL=1